MLIYVIRKASCLIIIACPPVGGSLTKSNIAISTKTTTNVSWGNCNQITIIKHQALIRCNKICQKTTI